MFFIASLRARPQHVERLRQVLQEIARQTAAEAGMVMYLVLQSQAEPALFRVVERYRDQAAWDFHLGSPHIRQALLQFEELLAAPLEVAGHDPVAGA